MRLSNGAKVAGLLLASAMFVGLVVGEGYVIVHFVSKFW